MTFTVIGNEPLVLRESLLNEYMEIGKSISEKSFELFGGMIGPFCVETIITEDIKEFLQNQEFINIATTDFDSRPNVAPKFLLKIEDDYIYLADYVMGRTYRNTKINPRVSLSTVNMDTLTGYQINGKAEIIEKGTEYESFIEQFRNKQIQFSVTRIIEGVHKEARHGTFETSLPERIAIFKIRAKEIVEIIPTGELKRRRR